MSTSGLPVFTPDSNSPINKNKPFLDWLEYVLDPLAPRIPQTISTSHGESVQPAPPDYAMTVCNLFAQLGLRGVGILTSSVNDVTGAGTTCPTKALSKSNPSPGSPHPVCVAHYTQTQVQVAHHTGTLSLVPGSLASVALSAPSVRTATPRLRRAFTVVASRTTLMFQTVSVTQCPLFIRNLGGRYDGLYNASNRGFPDIAAQVDDFQAASNGIFRIYGSSTSCGTPAA